MDERFVDLFVFSFGRFVVGVRLRDWREVEIWKDGHRAADLVDHTARGYLYLTDDTDAVMVERIRATCAHGVNPAAELAKARASMR